MDFYKTFNAALPQGAKNEIEQHEKYLVTFEGYCDYLLITHQLFKSIWVRVFIHQYVIEYKIKLRLQAIFTRQ
jgi:hypothetical protein